MIVPKFDEELGEVLGDGDDDSVGAVCLVLVERERVEVKPASNQLRPPPSAAHSVRGLGTRFPCFAGFHVFQRIDGIVVYIAFAEYLPFLALQVVSVRKHWKMSSPPHFLFCSLLSPNSAH